MMVGMKTTNVMLAIDYDTRLDPSHWWISEKYDGVRVFWNGSTLQSRSGRVLAASRRFTSRLPNVPLDGELWLGRGQFSQTTGALTTGKSHAAWNQMKLVVIDLPSVADPFESRMEKVNALCQQSSACMPMGITRCSSRSHMHDVLDSMVAGGAEGIMLREPGSPYQLGRCRSLVKVKPVQESDAQVIGHQISSKTGRVSALVVQSQQWKRFEIGSGITRQLSIEPPSIGSTVNFAYSGLTSHGLPRFPVLRGVRVD